MKPLTVLYILFFIFAIYFFITKSVDDEEMLIHRIKKSLKRKMKKIHIITECEFYGLDPDCGFSVISSSRYGNVVFMRCLEEVAFHEITQLIKDTLVTKSFCIGDIRVEVQKRTEAFLAHKNKETYSVGIMFASSKNNANKPKEPHVDFLLRVNKI